MRVPLTVNDFLYRAVAVSAYAAAVVDEPVQPAAPARTTTYAELLTRVRGWALPATGVAEGDEGAGLAGGAATRASRAATPRAGETWPIAGMQRWCSGAARRSSRRAVPLRTVSAHSSPDSGPVARRASPAARPREHAGVLSSTLCADRAVSTPLVARVAAQGVVPRPGAGRPAAPLGRGRCRSVRAGRPGREGVRPGGSR
jgi:hypothetical protein